MKRAIFFIIIIGINLYGFGQSESKKSFENLEVLKISRNGTDIDESISFNKFTSEIINKRFDELEKDDPFFMEECDGEYIKLLRTKIDNKTNEFYVIAYNPSCCCDYGFLIYKDGNPDEIIGHILAAKLYVPGNGFLYSEGRIWKNYNVRDKFIVESDSVKEIEQPFRYVGIESKALRTVKVYAEKELKTLIATVPKDYEIEVLVNDNKQKDLYLVRTSFGLVGWTELIAGQYSSVDVEGIYYWGD